MKLGVDGSKSGSIRDMHTHRFTQGRGQYHRLIVGQELLLFDLSLPLAFDQPLLAVDVPADLLPCGIVGRAGLD